MTDEFGVNGLFQRFTKLNHVGDFLLKTNPNEQSKKKYTNKQSERFTWFHADTVVQKAEHKFASQLVSFFRVNVQILRISISSKFIEETFNNLENYLKKIGKKENLALSTSSAMAPNKNS